MYCLYYLNRKNFKRVIAWAPTRLSVQYERISPKKGVKEKQRSAAYRKCLVIYVEMRWRESMRQ